jgi:hypothetical protein
MTGAVHIDVRWYSELRIGPRIRYFTGWFDSPDAATQAASDKAQRIEVRVAANARANGTTRAAALAAFRASSQLVITAYDGGDVVEQRVIPVAGDRRHG